ncbi:hypothetical protein LSTR_LSTR012081 [Laodelphax striatellus]|uniref:U6 small nuclear RNA (adenine-(43)-N(6))-methyltransferase n=1 Tax=Laodelphax striatellus TaxID=195883 RepID=A0A482WLA8_LAOST|nr:hypothetical protein LSTR_LSTR012081 [Laodelphax striatellus]
MLATEVDGVSIEYANSNVTTNELTDLIKVEQVTSDSVLLDVIKDKTGHFDFCMCNPPFFSSEDELQCSPARNAPRNAPTGCKSELVAPGGEVAFVKRIIDDSVQLGTKIRVYTTMLGKKTSLKDLQTYLGEKGEQFASLSVGCTEFCQGHTTRWGLAWSFLPGLNLPDLVKTRKKNEKKKNPAIATLKNCTLSNAVEKLNLLFKELGIHTKLMKENPSRVEMSIIALRNTWSHQRRKRRANKRQNKGEGDNGVNEWDRDGDSSVSKKSRLESASDDRVAEEAFVTNSDKVDSLSLKEGSVSEKVEFCEKANIGSNQTENISADDLKQEPEELQTNSQNLNKQPSNLPHDKEEKLETALDSQKNSSENIPNPSNNEKPENISSSAGFDVVENEKSELPMSGRDDENDGLDDYIGNKWADIDTLPLLTADLLLQNLGKDVMVAISLAEACVGGWQLVHQIRQIIINRVDLKKD